MVAAGAAAVVGGAIGSTPATEAVAANEICRIDAVTLAGKIRNKELSPTEVTEAVLARMEKLNPVLGAFCTPSPDVARMQAKAVEADIMAGRSVGPLAGVPVGIKDLVYTKGIKTTSGSIEKLVYCFRNIERLAKAINPYDSAESSKELANK
jgi:hypothetical protein